MAEALKSSPISCELLHDRTVNYAMQQNQVPVVKDLRIRNLGPENLANLSVKLSAEPEFASSWEIVLDSLPAGGERELGLIDLRLSQVFLASLTERLAGNLLLTVSQPDRPLYSERFPLEVLARDEWNGSQTVPEIIAAFITPNHPQIAGILRQASDLLKTWSGNPSLNGYQSKSPQRVRQMLAALFAALKVREIAYCVPPPSFEERGQKIRSAGEILTNRLATCLDFTVLFAACCEAAGLNPLVIFTEGHAFFGGWLVEESFAESVQDDLTLLTKRAAPGVSEICLLETTCLASGQNFTFEEALAQGEAQLARPEKFLYFVDIRRARAARIRPLPDGEAAPAPGAQIGPDAVPAAPPLPGEEPLPLDLSPQCKERTRLEQWERRLLDLSLRNPLLNFRVTGSSIPLLTAGLSDLEDALAQGEDFQIHPRPLDWEATPREAVVYQKQTADDPGFQLLKEEFARHRLRSDLPEKDLTARLTALYRAARNSLEENGANTLFIALGMLVWYETPESQKPRYAPILLLPMEMVRQSVRTGYLVREGEDDTQLNVTLLEMLKQDFNIDIPGLDPLPEDEHGVDVKTVFTAFRRAVMHMPRWDVLETANLGLFSFGKFVMWHDLKARADDLKKNKIVSSLMAGCLQWTPSAPEPEPELLDQLYRPEEILCPISADSSQLIAVNAAGQGRSFVLHGPPGTGKSQTITNIIAHTLAQGKTVLFVAEKMAALSVVQRRLEQIGLAPFCLELHSKKSKKKEVLEQLRLALETARGSAPVNWREEADRLAKAREELNAYVRALHSLRKIGHSVFEGLSRFAGVKSSSQAVSFSVEAVESLSPEKVREWDELVRQLRVSGSGCGGPKGHVWAASGLDNYQPQLKSQLAEILAALRSSLEKAALALPPVKERFSCGPGVNYRDFNALLSLSELFPPPGALPGALLRESDWDSVSRTIEEWTLRGPKRDALRSQLLPRYKADLKQLDITGLAAAFRQTQAQWFWPRFWGKWKVWRTLGRALKPGAKLGWKQLEEELRSLEELSLEEKIIFSGADKGKAWLGRLWNEGEADWEKIAQAGNWAGEVRKIAGEMASGSAERTSEFREKWAQLLEIPELWGSQGQAGLELSAFLQAGREFRAGWDRLEPLLKLTPWALLNDETVSDWPAAMAAQLKGWEGGLDSLRDWCAWVRVRDQALEAGLGPVVKPYELGELKTQELGPAYLRGLYQAWAENEIARDPVLASFSRGLFEDKIKKFCELDEQFSALTRREIYARLAERLPSPQANSVNNSEMGILQREILKQRGHMALRSLFQKIPNLLARVKPCLMMSPISVAQYLDPSHPPFDLVVFDEASQVPTCDAVGAVARGREVCVVGDPRQLPPTSFFNVMNAEEDEEALAVQDLESILDDCLAMGMPQSYLLWHYRSSHESLIAFSNLRYYENKLYTFPSPDDLTPAVRLVQVPGVYDRGKTRQNRAEAEAVADEIFRRLADPELSRFSIGVVTFSQAQQQLVEDLLDERLRDNSELEKFFSGDITEPVFVKNLENVQGDERDVILFSVGYGPDAAGRVSLNFGPLNQEGGWRRLNVAVSRARREMVIYSTLKAEQLDISRTSARGVADLKAFLEYAGGKKIAVSAPRSADRDLEADSRFEEQIAKGLEERGHQVHIQVGCSGYRIDLAVVDPEAPGKYLLGIECDGAAYRRARTARDRDKLREEVLRRLGWQIHRLWSADWWENAQSELERIEEAIKQAELNRKPVPAPAVKIVDKPFVPVAGQAASAEKPKAAFGEVYQAAELSPAGLDPEHFHAPASTRLIAAQIAEVINREGPVSHALLCRRIVQAWGISKVGSRIDARLREVCRALNLKCVTYDRLVYYWPEKLVPGEYTGFRTPGPGGENRREAEDLPPEEIANAALEVLKEQIGLPENELVKQTARLFGFQRLGAEAAAHFGRGIEKLIRSCKAGYNQAGYVSYEG